MNNLPTDVLKIICSYLDIDTIENFYIVTEYLENVLTWDFWKLYFINHNLSFITKQDEPLSWIYEFKVNQIFKIIPMKKSTELCQYVFKRGQMKGRTCQKPTMPGSNFCTTCSRRPGRNDINTYYMKIEFSIPINLNLSSFSVDPTYGFTFPHDRHTALIAGNNDNYIVINKHENNIRGYRATKEQLHNILFESFENENIISYREN